MIHQDLIFNRKTIGGKYGRSGQKSGIKRGKNLMIVKRDHFLKVHQTIPPIINKTSTLA